MRKFLKSFREYLSESAKGTYAGVRFSEGTVDNLIQLQGDLGIPNPVPYNKFHSTLLYSRKHLPKYVAKGACYLVSDGNEFTLEIWESDKSFNRCLVLRYDCGMLSARHDFLMRYHEATYDFDEYKPHITLSYDVGDSWTPLEKTVKFSDSSPIEIVEEYQEDLNLDWSTSALKEHITQGVKRIIW